MKKILIGSVIVIFIGIFFVLPLIPRDFVLMTKMQRKAQEDACKIYSCGLTIMLTPYKYIEQSFTNLVIRNKNIINEENLTGERPEVPVSNQ